MRPLIASSGQRPRKARPANIESGAAHPVPRHVVCYFGRGSSTLRPRYRQALQRVARRMTSASALRPVVVEGHANCQDTESGAVSLSRRRAESVARALRTFGVPRKLIKIVARGSRLRTTERTRGRVPAWNRRVELALLPPPTAAAVAEAPGFIEPPRMAAPVVAATA